VRCVVAQNAGSIPLLPPAIEIPSPDTRLKRFPQNLGKNFLGLFDKKNVLPLVIGGSVTAIVSPFDDDLKDSIGMKGESSTFGKIGAVVGGPAVVLPTVTGLLIGGHYSDNVRFRVFTYNLAQATAINESIVQGLKIAVGRTRPDGSDNRSFPSGHAATSFMIATVVHRSYGRTAGIFGYSTATFISFSRLRDNKHWASDLAAGATLGYIVGSSVTRRNGLSLRVGKITFVPAFNPLQRTVGVNLVADSE
ncbi:MAG: phosphatase PAP2 family protein, partial [Acidobacteria bacterium]